MRIPENILAECHAHGVKTYPDESCGFIAGDIDDPESLDIVFPMQNISNILNKKDPKNYPRTGHDSYVIDPHEHIKLERSLKKLGKKIKVIYHSHPDVGAYFSEKDKEDALWNGNARFPGITFLVCATNQGEPGDAILANFNSNKKDFDITRIPAKNDIISSELLGGTYGVSGILPTLEFIKEWKNGKRELEYGYFRFVPHKNVKKLQQKLAFRNKARHAIAYSSGRTALLELLSYLKDSLSLTNLLFSPKTTFQTDAFQSLELQAQYFNLKDLPRIENILENKDTIFLITPQDTKKFKRKHTDWIKKLKQLQIPIIVYEEATSEFWKIDFQNELTDGITFWITDLVIQKNNNLKLEITGGVILSNNDRQIAELLELHKKHGAILSARNAEIFLEKFTENYKVIKSNSKNFTKIEKNHDSIHEDEVIERLCELENASSGLLFPSGMAAITSLLTILQKKEKKDLIVIGLLYSDTYSLLMDYGRSSTFDTIFLGLNELNLLPEVLTNDTAMVITETITNPLCGVPDLERIGELTNKLGIPFLVDNTLASPTNCKPINWGADYVIHSTTKYLSGNNDHAGGAILIKSKKNTNDLKKFQQNWGLLMSSLESKVLHQRISDFEERMFRFNKNNLIIAHFLESHPAVERVYYAFSDRNVSSAPSSKLLSGSGGVVSFVLKNDTEENLQKFYDGEFSSITKAPTLGSNQTLICPYSILTHFHASNHELLEIELPRHLIRIATGSEKKIDPIVKDLNSALKRTV